MIKFSRPGRKGVSPVIAVVLMIAVAVAISIIVFAWSSGFVSERSSTESAQAEHLVVEEMSLSGTALTLHLRNGVSFLVVIDTVYVNGEMKGNELDWAIGANRVTSLDLSSLGSFYPGDRVKIVTKRGTQIVFSVKKE